MTYERLKSNLEWQLQCITAMDAKMPGSILHFIKEVIKYNLPDDATKADVLKLLGEKGKKHLHVEQKGEGEQQ